MWWGLLDPWNICLCALSPQASHHKGGDTLAYRLRPGWLSRGSGPLLHRDNPHACEYRADNGVHGAHLDRALAALCHEALRPTADVGGDCTGIWRAPIDRPGLEGPDLGSHRGHRSAYLCDRPGYLLPTR